MPYDEAAGATPEPRFSVDQDRCQPLPASCTMMRTFSVGLLMAVLVLLSLADRAQAQPRMQILFDQGHGQRFLVERGKDLDLSLLAELFVASGSVVTTTEGPLTPQALANAQVLIISGAFRPFTPVEIDAVTGFIAKGGTVCVMIHIAPPLADLLYRLGVDYANGILHDDELAIGGDSLNFGVTRLARHPLVKGISRFNLYGAWALRGERAEVVTVAETSPTSWVDQNGDGRYTPGETRQSFAVAVAGTLGRGRYVVFGDDALFQNKFLTGYNLDLARNLVGWLIPANPPPTR